MSDIVGALDVTLLPVIGMLVFVLAFCTIVVRAILADRRSIGRAACIPLEDEPADARTGHPQHAERRAR